MITRMLGNKNIGWSGNVYKIERLLFYCYPFDPDPSHLALVEHWRIRPTLQDTLFDVYDGRMWWQVPSPLSTPAEFIPFVHHPYHLLLTLNVDWFQAFDKKGPYSVGAMYMTINNLPRHLRFKKENVILVGVMPGPREPEKEQINHYLRPLVQELHDLYQDGITMDFGNDKVLIRAALFNVACDIPAARKVSGFTAASAIVLVLEGAHLWQ